MCATIIVGKRILAFQESHLLPAGKSQQHNQYITFVEMCRYILTLIYKQNTPKNQIFGVFVVLITFILL